MNPPIQDLKIMQKIIENNSKVELDGDTVVES